MLSNPLVGFAGRAAAGAGVVQNFNDYKLNDPGVDSSASGTWNALRRGDMSAAGASLSKGAKEAAMDVGSNIANTADLVVPGTGPSQAYNKALRDHFGSRLIDNSGSASSTGVGVEPPQQLASYAGRGEAWDSRRLDANGGRGDLSAAADPRRLDLDPGRSSLGASRDFTNELSGRPGGKMAALPNDLRQGVVHKTVDAQGRVTYSGRNVGVNGDGETQMVDGTGRTLKMLNGNNNSYVRSVGADGKPDGPMVVPGMTTLRGGAGGVNAALSAAAARGDMDAVRGYYADKGETFAGVTPEQYKLRQEEAGAPKRGEPGYNRYQAIKTARDQNETTRRGQDMDMQGRRLTNESNKLRLQFDMGKDKRDFDEARGNKAFDQTIQGTEALHKKVLNSLPFVKGDKGPEPDAAGAAAYMNGANAAVARRANELRKAGRGAEAAQLEGQGVANISASDHQNLVDGIEMMKRFSEKNSEWFTSGTSGKMSNNPLDFLVVGPDPKNPKKVLLAGGQTMDMDDVAGMKLANRFGLPQTGNPQTDRFLPK